MIKVEVIKEFDLKAFNELKNIKRAGKDVKGSLFVGDTFECSQDMVEYLTGNNRLGKVVVKVIEVEPEKVEEPKEDWAVTQENDGKVHIRPIEDGEIIDTPIEKIIKPKKKKNKK